MQRRSGRPVVPEVTTMSLTESEPTGAGSKSGWVTAGDEFREKPQLRTPASYVSDA